MAFQRRVRRLFLIAIAVFAVIWLRVLQLQVIEGDRWEEAARSLRTAHVIREAPRGRILDRHGEVLAQDLPVFHLAVTAGAWRQRARTRCTGCGAIHFHRVDRNPRRDCACGERGATLEPLPLPRPDALEEALGLPRGRLTELAADRSEEVRHLTSQHMDRLEENGWPAFLIGDALRDYETNLLLRPKVVVRAIAPEAVRLVELDEDGTFRGFTVVADLRRTYPQGDLAAQMLGYVTVVEDAEELRRAKSLYGDNVTLDTRLGRSGLEAYYDGLLLGRLGDARLARDEDGHFTVVLEERPPERGKDLRLALTVEACKVAEEALARRGPPEGYAPGALPSGGLVALDATTGAVVAWGEMPRFDLAGDLGKQLFDLSERGARFDEATGQWVPADDVPSPESLEHWRQTLSKPAPRRLSRVSQIAVEPGSTLKTLIGLGMLESGLSLPYASFDCGGWRTQPNCHPHGPVDFEGALCVSCNRYFSLSFRDQGQHWPVYRRAVPELLSRMGLGQRTEVDVARETTGTFLWDWIDFDPRAPVRAAVEAFATSGRAVALDLGGDVPGQVAGRGPERLQGALEGVLGEAVQCALGGRVLLRVTRAGGVEREVGLGFDVFVERRRGAEEPPRPDATALARALRPLGGEAEIAPLPSGGTRISFRLGYQRPIGRAAGEPPLVLPDDGRMVAIGQGPVTVTPLQLARAMAALANGGRLVTPHVALDADGEPLRFAVHDLRLGGGSLARVRQGMNDVVERVGGTAHGLGFERVPATVYAKTGTSETGAWWVPGPKPEKGPWHHWFVGFAEAPGRPPLAFACVLHARLEGAAARTAALATLDFLDWWFTTGPGTE